MGIHAHCMPGMETPLSSPRDPAVPDDPYDRCDWLASMVDHAMGFSSELAPAISQFTVVTRVAVDVTYGDATDADLRVAAEQCLVDLQHMAKCCPLRRVLKQLVDSIGQELPNGAGNHADVDALSDEPDNANDEGSLSTQKGGSRSAADRAA